MLSQDLRSVPGPCLLLKPLNSCQRAHFFMPSGTELTVCFLRDSLPLPWQSSHGQGLASWKDKTHQGTSPLGVASGHSLSDTKSLVPERVWPGSGNAGGLFPLIFRTVKTVYILSGGGGFRAKLQKDLALHLWQVLAAAIGRADRGQGDQLGFSRAPHTHGKEEPN